MLGESFYKKADEIIEMHTREERSLIPIIQDIQEEYRYLPPGTADICGERDWHNRGKSLQCSQFL